MTDETRKDKDQEQKDQLTDKDLDTASGGLSVHSGSKKPDHQKEDVIVRRG